MTRPSGGTDLAALVKRVIQGEGDAEAELVRRYKDGLSIIIGRIVRNPSVSEDLVQDTFRIAFEKIRHGDVREPERISGFICGIARNLAIDHTRRMKPLPTHEQIGDAERLVDPAPDQLDQLHRKERAELVRRVLGEMKVPRDREILYRSYICDEDKDIICRDLGLTRAQFNRVMFRALKRYRDLYEKLVGGS